MKQLFKEIHTCKDKHTHDEKLNKFCKNYFDNLSQKILSDAGNKSYQDFRYSMNSCLKLVFDSHGLKDKDNNPVIFTDKEKTNIVTSMLVCVIGLMELFILLGNEDIKISRDQSFVPSEISLDGFEMKNKINVSIINIENPTEIFSEEPLENDRENNNHFYKNPNISHEKTKTHKAHFFWGMFWIREPLEEILNEKKNKNL